MPITLENKVVIITGASRGIGEAIGKRFAKAGAKIAIWAKTAEPHATLPGTIYTVAEEIEKADGVVLPLKVDVRFEEQVKAAVDKVVETFGRIDILINNASAISLSPTLKTPMKRFDLMHAVNVRGTFLCSQLCLPYLMKGDNPHILNLSPPLNLNAKWFKDHLAYTMSKYGMSMCTLGLAEEFREQGIAVNSLWPKTPIATSAIAVHFPESVYQASRKPEIVADAAFHIVNLPSRKNTGQFFIDEDVLRNFGVKTMQEYAVDPKSSLMKDFFLD